MYDPDFWCKAGDARQRAPFHRAKAVREKRPARRGPKAAEGLLEELLERDGTRIGWLHREYLWAEDPRKQEEAKKASAGYRMRMLTLELWQKWPKIRLHLRRLELGLDGAPTTPRNAHRQE